MVLLGSGGHTNYLLPFPNFRGCSIWDAAAFEPHAIGRVVVVDGEEVMVEEVAI